MDLIEAREMALSLMKKHGLFERGWSFSFNNHKTQLGLAQEVEDDHGVILTRTLYLSRPLTQINEPEVMRKVMLHEIAHALAGTAAKHGRLWKAHAIALGVSPTRYTPDAVEIVGKVLGTCELGCGYEYRQHRITWTTYTKTICPDCSDRKRRMWVYLDWTRDGKPIPRPAQPKPRKKRTRRNARR